MRVQLLRHATLLAHLAGADYLIDPMLSPAEAWEPVRNSANPRRNPMVELPLKPAELDTVLDGLAAAFVTHTHADHWDQPAQERLRKDLPVFCQPNDTEAISRVGFRQVIPVDPEVKWGGLQVQLTGGRHGTGEVAERIGPVSGFILRAENEPSLYIAGDTIWCEEVEAALEAHRPAVVVINAGAAQFTDSGPITMDAADVLAVARAAPESRVVAVHFESINHCVLSRREMREQVDRAGLAGRVLIPADGEVLEYA
jgi:L-ascorbate metabolism protein UlaG (beta-lactamase superfamily)